MTVFAGGRFCVWKYDGGPPCEFCWPSEPKMEFWNSGELSCEKQRVEMAGRAASGDVLEMRCGRDDRRRPEAVEATSRVRDAIVCG